MPEHDGADIDVAPYGPGEVAVMINGSDIVHIAYTASTRWLQVTVWDSTHPNASIAWQGEITWENQDRLEDSNA